MRSMLGKEEPSESRRSVVFFRGLVRIWKRVFLLQFLRSIANLSTPISVDPSTSTSADKLSPQAMPKAISGRNASLSQPSFAPYADDPEQGLGIEPAEPATMLQTQRHMMDGACFLLSCSPLWNKQGLIEQDQYLDLLSHSINRQHHMSLQINDELDVHSNLLEELDTQLDRTEGRLGRARRSLDKVARGVKNNGLFCDYMPFRAYLTVRNRLGGRDRLIDFHTANSHHSFQDLGSFVCFFRIFLNLRLITSLHPPFYLTGKYMIYTTCCTFLHPNFSWLCMGLIL